MITIPIRTRLESDGTLDLHVATGLPPADVEVLIVVQPVLSPPEAWPPGFFEQTYGAFSDVPIERGDQGSFDARRALR